MKIVFNKDISGNFKQESWCYSTVNPDKQGFEIDNKEFTTTLKYLEYEPGRFACNIQWLDTNNNNIYISTINVLSEALKRSDIKGNLLTGTFIWYKRGQSILLKQIS